MKSKYVLAGLIVLSVTMLSFPAVNAQTVYFPHLRPVPSGVVWQFSTTEPVEGWSFSGTDIIQSTVKAYWWATLVPETEIQIKKIIITDKLVTLIFDAADLPALAEGTKVTGEIVGGDSFIATGPGFAFARRPP